MVSNFTFFYAFTLNYTKHPEFDMISSFCVDASYFTFFYAFTLNILLYQASWIWHDLIFLCGVYINRFEDNIFKWLTGSLASCIQTNLIYWSWVTICFLMNLVNNILYSAYFGVYFSQESQVELFAWMLAARS